MLWRQKQVKRVRDTGGGVELAKPEPEADAGTFPVMGKGELGHENAVFIKDDF